MATVNDQQRTILIEKALEAVRVEPSEEANKICRDIVETISTACDKNQKLMADELQVLAKSLEAQKGQKEAFDFKQKATAIMLELSMEERRKAKIHGQAREQQMPQQQMPQQQMPQQQMPQQQMPQQQMPQQQTPPPISQPVMQEHQYANPPMQPQLDDESVHQPVQQIPPAQAPVQVPNVQVPVQPEAMPQPGQHIPPSTPQEHQSQPVQQSPIQQPQPVQQQEPAPPQQQIPQQQVPSQPHQQAPVQPQEPQRSPGDPPRSKIIGLPSQTSIPSKAGSSSSSSFFSSKIIGAPISPAQPPSVSSDPVGGAADIDSTDAVIGAGVEGEAAPEVSIPFKRLVYLYMGTSDYEATLNYYLEILRGEQVWQFDKFDSRVTAIRLSAGPLVLISDHRKAPSCQPVFEVDDLKTTARELGERGWKEQAGPFNTPNGEAYAFTDPSGNSIAFFQVDPDSTDRSYVDPTEY